MSNPGGLFYGYEEDKKLPISGGTMTGDITMGNNDISNVKSITFSSVVDNIDFNDKQLKNISAPTDAQDAISKVALESTLLGYKKRFGWKVTHEIDVANCDIQYWTGSPTLVKDTIDRNTTAIGTSPGEAHSMGVGGANSGTRTCLRCRRAGNDSSIRIPCGYIDRADYTLYF